MKKVLLSILLISMLMTSMFFPMLSGELEINTIIYVDDDNNQGPWDGSKKYPYQHIQDGIDNASAYDTIFVKEGRYVSKDIFITKPLILQGENVYQTKITYAGYAAYSSVIHIQSSHVNITSFTITNRNKFGNGIVLIDYNDCTINGNIFNTTYTDNQAVGVYLENADKNVICNNEFTNFWKSIVLADSMRNHIKSNNFNATSYGGHFFHAYHLQYLPKFIIGNIFKNNYYHERTFIKTTLNILAYYIDIPSEFYKLSEGPKLFAIPIVKWLILADPDPDHGITFPFLLPVLKFELAPSLKPNNIGG